MPAAADYASAMRQALRSVTGDLPGYHFRATPLGNFGVGSLYVDEIANADLAQAESSWYLGSPDTWLAADRSAAERQRLLARLVAEGSMGAVNLDAAGARELHAQASVALLTALVGSARIDTRSGLDTRVTATDVRNRRLNWAEFEAALRAGRIAPAVADVVRRGRFVVAAADVVLVGYRAEITVDESRNPQVAAGLRAKTLIPTRVQGSAAFQVSEQTAGRFVVSAPQPVVAAVLFKRPPPVGKDLSSPTNLDAWPAASVNERAVDAVESRVLKDRQDRQDRQPTR